MSAPRDDDAPLPVVAAAQLDEPDPTRRWLVEPLWPAAGVGIIGGAPKCCKSWLALDLALSVASATPCLGAFPVHGPGPALVYMAEDSAATVKQRLQGLCRHRALDLAALPVFAITAPSVRLDLPHDQRRLARTVQQHAPRLLVLDPFVRLHRINENQAGEVACVLGYLRELQRTHDLAVLVVHHVRKNGAPNAGGHSLRGSGDFFAWVDTALLLRRQRHHLVLSVEHRAASAPAPCALALAGGEHDAHLELLSDDGSPDTAPHAAADLDAALLAALDAAPQQTLTRAALRAALRVRNERLSDALARLHALGRLERHDGLVRSLPARGGGEAGPQDP